MVEVTPTVREMNDGRLETDSLSSAVKAIREDGFVVLNDVIDHGHLDALRVQMEADLEKIRALPNVPYNFVWGNIQQDPPPHADLIFRDVVANPYVCQVTHAVLGDDAFNNYLSGNSNLPGSKLQPVHVDDGQLWPDLERAHPASRLAVNVSLGEVTEENGAIELWPGTHLDTMKVVGESIRVDETALEARRSIVPPISGNTRKGAFLVRDMRVWHRGTPNLSDEIRFMIAMIHYVSWHRRHNRFDLDRECEPVFEGCPIENAIPLVETPSDHISRNTPYEYDGLN